MRVLATLQFSAETIEGHLWHNHLAGGLATSLKSPLLHAPRLVLSLAARIKRDTWLPLNISKISYSFNEGNTSLWSQGHPPTGRQSQSYKNSNIQWNDGEPQQVQSSCLIHPSQADLQSRQDWAGEKSHDHSHSRNISAHLALESQQEKSYLNSVVERAGWKLAQICRADVSIWKVLSFRGYGVWVPIAIPS